MEYLFFTAMCVAIGLFAACAAFITGNWWILIVAATWLLGAYVPYSFWRDNKQLEEEERLDRLSGENHA